MRLLLHIITVVFPAYVPRFEKGRAEDDNSPIYEFLSQYCEHYTAGVLEISPSDLCQKIWQLYMLNMLLLNFT